MTRAEKAVRAYRLVRLYGIERDGVPVPDDQFETWIGTEADAAEGGTTTDLLLEILPRLLTDAGLIPAEPLPMMTPTGEAVTSVDIMHEDNEEGIHYLRGAWYAGYCNGHTYCIGPYETEVDLDDTKPITIHGLP